MFINQLSYIRIVRINNCSLDLKESGLIYTTEKHLNKNHSVQKYVGFKKGDCITDALLNRQKLNSYYRVRNK